MALVKCPKCGRIVSTFADKCPHCGLPITDEVKDAAVNIADSISQDEADVFEKAGFDISPAETDIAPEDVLPLHEETGEPESRYEQTETEYNEIYDEEGTASDNTSDKIQKGSDRRKAKIKNVLLALLVVSSLVLTLITLIVVLKPGSSDVPKGPDAAETETVSDGTETADPTEAAVSLDGSGKKISDAFFNRLRDYTVGNYRLKVPEEWEDQYPYVYPEREDDSYAMMYASADNREGCTNDDLEKYADAMIDDLKNKHKDSTLAVKERMFISDTGMIHARIDSKEPGAIGIIDVYWFLDKGDYRIITVVFFEGTDTKYDYSDVFSRIIHSLKFTGTAAPSNSPSPSPSAYASPSPSPSPSPSKTREPERTARPTTKPSASPTNTPQPTPDTTPGPTPEPTPEPTPDDTPEPTPDTTPEPTPDTTPEPTPEPTPEKTQEPEKTKEPEPDTEP